MFYFRDISQNHHPYRELTVSMIAAHEAPLWNPARGAGQPLLANPNALVLHPTTLLFLVLPVASAMKMSVILQILLAGIATWLLLRDAGVSRAGSLLGAGVFAFSGYMISLGNLLNLLDSAAFMPLTLWLAARAVKLRFAPWGSLAALSLAVQVAAGEPAILLCTGLGFVALHWSFPAVSGQAARPAGTRVAVVIGLILLAGTLAMVQLLPTLELLGQSERGAGFDRDETMKWSLPPAALIESVVPGWYGDPTRADTTKFRGGSVFDAGLPFILSIYLGPAALLLAGLGIAGALRCKGARRTETIALSSIALGGVLLSLGRFFPLYPALLAMAPPMQSVRYPVKYFVLVAWALAILSARGYDTCLAWSEAAGDRPRKKSPATVFALMGVVALGAVIAMQATGGVMRPGLSIARTICIIVTASALILMRSSRINRFGLALLPLLDLVTAGSHINPVAPASFYSEPPALARVLGAGDSAGRLAALPRPRGFAYRTPTDAGLPPDSLAGGFRWDRMTLRNATYFPEGYRFAYDRGNERLDVMPGAALGRMIYEGAGVSISPEEVTRLLSVAAVDRVITYGGLSSANLAEAGRLEGESNIPVVVMRNEAALPRAYFVANIEIHADIVRAAKRLREPDFDPRTTVILESGEAAPESSLKEPAANETHLKTSGPNQVTVQLSTSRPGYLVLADTFYPGWIAEVDGLPSPIIRANAMFRAVAVSAGEHIVEFRYRPSSVRSGLMVTAAGLVLAGLLAVPRRR